MTTVTIEQQIVTVTPSVTGVDVMVAPVPVVVTVSGGSGPQGPQGPPGPTLTVAEIDGAPTVADVSVLRVSNGTLTDDGNGQVTLTALGGSDAYYRHVQSVAAAVWTVVHNLGKRPAVSVVDSAGDEVYGKVHYDSDTQVTLSFSAAFGGEAYFN